MKTESPVSFVIQHLDSCDRCNVGDFCPTGIQLMHRGCEIASKALCPIPEIPRSKFKA